MVGFDASRIDLSDSKSLSNLWTDFMQKLHRAWFETKPQQVVKCAFESKVPQWIEIFGFMLASAGLLSRNILRPIASVL
jgi:hypothetical protein